MEDYIYHIRKYLPLIFADDEANEFLEYLQESYIENLENEKYQFSFKAFHMLYMTFIYKITWFLNKKDPGILDELRKEYSIKIKESGAPEIKDTVLTIAKMFHQSQINESKSIVKLLSIIDGFDYNDVEKCLIHIKIRNHCSHATGKIYHDEKAIDHYINDEIGYVEKLQVKMAKELRILFLDYLDNNWYTPIQTGYVRSWIIENFLSEKDLEIIAEFELPFFEEKSDNRKTIYQKLLYLAFIDEAQKCTEIEKNIFLDKLPIFMKGLKDEIKFIEDGEEKTISTQEIIKEYLIPIVTDLSGKEREEAEKILNFS